ncbi:hypothetical protein A4G19_05970 [Pasteurellaceae bacterium Macca]|nr:hypothetical protein [Pasteurellaceae bacterium Macca]
MLKGYVINLDQRPDRLQRFNQHPDAKYFTRFSAIDKQVISALGEYHVFDTQRYLSVDNRPVTAGEIGCTLSHIGCWKLIAEDDQLNDEDFVVIAEDDVELVPRFSLYAQKLIESLQDPKESQIHFVVLQKLGLHSQAPFEVATETTTNFVCQKLAYAHQCIRDGSSLYLRGCPR